MFEVLRMIVPDTDHDYSAMRFENHEADILKLINTYQTDDVTMSIEPEWLFPKGKPEKFEDGVVAASREFREETGITETNMKITSINPIVSFYQADNDFIYETQYWIYIFDDEPSLPNRFQSFEVMSRKWMNIDDVLKAVKRHQIVVVGEAINQIQKLKIQIS